MRISALALLKMTMHAKSGGNLEVMGVMQGKVAGDTFIVLDAFALPVEGTETRVNAQAEAYEYMVDFLSTAQAAGRPENVVGWYHSHPGYGCWLSGIDVSTQMTNQQYQEPFLAVVIDPHRTMAAGKVELGAFRTYPAGYSPPEDAGESKYQTIPLEKIEDFGVHANQYYPLKVSYFKSALDAALVDAVWGRYWASSLSSSPLISTRRLVIDQMTDVGKKLGAALETVHGLGTAKGLVGRFPSQKRSQDENKIALVAQDATGVSQELLKGLSSLVVKELMFRRNCGPGSEHVVGPLPNTNTSNIDDEKDSSDTR